MSVGLMQHAREHIVIEAELKLGNVVAKLVYSESPQLLLAQLLIPQSHGEVTLHEQDIPPCAEACEHLSDAREAVATLTPGELCRCVASVLGTVAKYEIREERHGTCSKPGCLA